MTSHREGGATTAPDTRAPYWSYHCTACGESDGSPIVIRSSRGRTCCTCCKDSEGNRNPGGMSDGRGW